MNKSYYFYVSYEREECDDYMGRFIRELIAEVGSISGVARNRVAFFDQDEVSAGDEWESACSAGLQASRTLVPLFSPAYFRHPAPRQELEFFRARMDDAEREGPPSSLIVPVLWGPRDLLPNVPHSVHRILPGVNEYPAEFVNEGLRWVMRRGGHYKLFRETLAGNIVRAAEAAVLPAPRTPQIPAPIVLANLAPVPPPGASGAGRLRVFLCHASEDKKRVRALFNRLKADGVEPWLDQVNLLPGQRWKIKIRQAVESSHAFIVCLSRNARPRKRKYIRTEIAHALRVSADLPTDNEFIIPVKLEECKIPHRLRSRHTVDLFARGGYSKLKNVLDLRAHELGLERTRWPDGPAAT